MFFVLFCFEEEELPNLNSSAEMEAPFTRISPETSWIVPISLLALVLCDKMLSIVVFPEPFFFFFWSQSQDRGQDKKG